MNAPQIVEAVLFAADAPLTADEIARADESLNEDLVEEALQFLRAEYDDGQRAFQVVEVAEGYQILTRPEFAPYLERFDNVPRPSRLSGPSLETLAIIAYRQPIGRIEIEYIRGVGASGVVRTLQERRLIDVVGRDEGLGRPLLYGTTQHFLEHFGFKSMEDLPRPEELPIILRERIPLGPEPTEEETAQQALDLDGSETADAAGTGDDGPTDAASDEAPPAEDEGAEPASDADTPGESGVIEDEVEEIVVESEGGPDQEVLTEAEVDEAAMDSTIAHESPEAAPAESGTDAGDGMAGDFDPDVDGPSDAQSDDVVDESEPAGQQDHEPQP